MPNKHMWMGTFQAFGLDLIRIYHAELKLPGDPRMMDRVEAAELLEREFPRLALRGVTTRVVRRCPESVNIRETMGHRVFSSAIGGRIMRLKRHL
jgi:hypothetical protein